MPLISGAQLKSIVATLPLTRAALLADQFERALPRYNMTNPDILPEFIANLAEESWGFRKREECLNYSAEALIKTWPKHFKDLKFAQAYARQPEKLGNFIYGPESSIGKDLGNSGATDGWDLRGGGFIMITGRYGWAAYAKYRGFQNALEAANSVRGSDFWSLDSACWFFAVQKNLIQAAIDDKFVQVCKAINGGTLGLAERQLYYERAQKCI